MFMHHGWIVPAVLTRRRRSRDLCIFPPKQHPLDLSATLVASFANSGGRYFRRALWRTRTVSDLLSPLDPHRRTAISAPPSRRIAFKIPGMRCYDGRHASWADDLGAGRRAFAVRHRWHARPKGNRCPPMAARSHPRRLRPRLPPLRTLSTQDLALCRHVARGGAHRLHERHDEGHPLPPKGQGVDPSQRRVYRRLERPPPLLALAGRLGLPPLPRQRPSRLRPRVRNPTHGPQGVRPQRRILAGVEDPRAGPEPLALA
ncbi:hypothetical protein OF83DRAFT_881394 [Amylostereum chailletii]|nr:hypothetical protein OF83DRAFT_881394 [Amylostereum chailletii]